MTLASHHAAWLSAHPERSEQWLTEMIGDGFHVHHVDGDKDNDDPANLLLIDGVDHMRLHGMDLAGGITSWRRRPKPRKASYLPCDEACYRARTRGLMWGDVAMEVIGKRTGRRALMKAKRYASITSSIWPPFAR